LPASVDLRRALVEPRRHQLSICRQCELRGLNRSTSYLPPATESAENPRLMRLIDRQLLKAPLYGSRRMAECLKRSGEAVNRKRARRLMASVGPEAPHPRPRTTAAAGAKAYPYPLRDREPTRVDEVWSSDITSVPVRHGFM
jgi:putative transposase